jgi:tetratricopeptide (TPR) repeat protein
VASYLAIVLAFWIQADSSLPSVLSLLKQGHAQYRSGHYAEAERSLTDVLGRIGETDEQLRAKVLADLGDVYSEQEEFLKAEGAYTQALSLLKRLSDTNESALLLHNLAMLRSREGKNDDALALLEKAARLTKSASLSDPALEAQLFNGFGIVYYREKKNSKAEKSFNQALDVVRASGISFNTAGILNNLGAVYLHQHKFKEAEDVANRALEIKEAESGPFDPGLLPELDTLGVIYGATGRHELAKEQYERALKILEPHRSDFAPSVARVLHLLSITYANLGLRADSDETLAEAAKIAGDNLSKDSQMAEILEDYSRLLKSHGRTQEAAGLLAQVKHARAVSDLVVRARSEF